MGTAASSSAGGRSKVKPLAAGATRAVSAPVRRASAVQGASVSVEDVDDGERGSGGSDLTVTRTRSIKSASAGSRLQGASAGSTNDIRAADACAECARFEAALSATEAKLDQVREELKAAQARAEQAEAKLLQDIGAVRAREGPGATLLAPAKPGPRPGLLPGLDRSKQLQDQLLSHKERELKECRESAKAQQAQLEKRMARLKSKLKKAKAESSAQVMELQERVAELEKENSALRVPTKVSSGGTDGSDINTSDSEEPGASSAQTNLILNLSSHIEELDEELQAARERIAELEAAT
eukprot:m.443849 g.443849  ORF g.443849 m.443849 type:complete len:297 (+) comp20295_c5_seq8:243-1133(+)